MEELNELLRNFDIRFSDDVHDLLKCTICHKVFFDEFVASCACKFCSSCIEDYLKDGGRLCPGAKDECKATFFNAVSELVKDPACNIQISYLFVGCPNENCDHQCQLRKLPEHMRMCPKAPEECVYSYVGCMDGSVVNDRMKEHLEERSVTHGRALVAHMRNMDNETKERINRYEKSLETLVQDNVALKAELRASRENVEALRQRLDECERKQADTEQQMRNISDGTAAEATKMQEEFRKLLEETKNEKSEWRKAEAELRRLLENRKDTDKTGRVKDGVGGFVWLLEGISEKLNKEREYSCPFFSSGTIGYKLCLYFYMFSSGCLYLAFCLMPGADDNLLQWPMKRTVVIEIIDQQSGVAVMSRPVCLATAAERKYPENRRKAYDRPIKGRNEWGDGFIECVTYEQMKSTPGAIRNDAMTVRCRVLPE